MWILELILDFLIEILWLMLSPRVLIRVLFFTSVVLIITFLLFTK
jgi:hypothetical protein